MSRAVRGARSRGFSLVEMIIVLAIMAILGTIGASHVLAARPHAQLETAELVVTSAVAEARSIATSEEVPVHLTIDAAGGTWQVQKLEGGVWVDAMPAGELTAGVTFGDVTFDGGILEYTTRGSLMAGGSIELVSSAGESHVLTGSLASGRFTVTEGNLR